MGAKTLYNRLNGDDDDNNDDDVGASSVRQQIYMVKVSAELR